jgi:hypothetical protein
MPSTADTKPRTRQATVAYDPSSADPDWATPHYHPGFLDLLKLRFMESALRRGTRGPSFNGHYLSRDEMERLVAFAREQGWLASGDTS